MSNKKQEYDGTIGTQNHLALTEGVSAGVHIVPNLFSTYTEMVMHEAEVRHLGVFVGGRLLSNLCHADDTALCANNHHDADEIIN